LEDVVSSGLYLGIRWYSQYPNHYAGDAKGATAAIGKLSIEGRTQKLVDMIKTVKADKKTIDLQNEFFKESLSPLDTKAK
jgi:creatinine amidohydrolase